MRRKLLVLLETGLILAGLLLGFSAWKVHSALEQPLHLTGERLLDARNNDLSKLVYSIALYERGPEANYLRAAELAPR